MHVCIFPECLGHDDRLDALLHGQQATHAHLDRLERLVRTLTLETEHNMSDLDAKLAAISGALDTLDADEQRALADLQALRDAGQTLTPDQEAQLDAILAKVQAEDAAVNTADPAPAPPADGSGDTTPPADGSSDGTDATAA